jgi:hypothetical protein
MPQVVALRVPVVASLPQGSHLAPAGVSGD